jgi:hypothetical protein
MITSALAAANAAAAASPDARAAAYDDYPLLLKGHAISLDFAGNYRLDKFTETMSLVNFFTETSSLVS